MAFNGWIWDTLYWAKKWDQIENLVVFSWLLLKSPPRIIIESGVESYIFKITSDNSAKASIYKEYLPAVGIYTLIKNIGEMSSIPILTHTKFDEEYCH